MKRRDLLKATLAFPTFAGLPHLQVAAKAQERVFAQPNIESKPVLPRDHGPHPEFRTEWWYFTGWFNSPSLDTPLGVQITFFRSAPQVQTDNPSRFTPGQLLFAHAAVAMPSHKKLKHDQIIRRAGSGGSSLTTDKNQVLTIQMPGWTLSSVSGDDWVCNIRTPKLEMSLRMKQTRAPWMQGQNGYSRKGPKPEQSSYYITLPHMQSEGTVVVDGKSLEVTGTFWMDHEWSSTVLAPNAQGWDWVGLHGDEGQALMAFQIRDRNAAMPPVWTHAAMQLANGQTKQFKSVQFKATRRWKSTATGIEYPVEQVLEIDGLSLRLEPLFDNQELDARASTGTLYWEGAIQVKTIEGLPWGRGYLEMTGYDRPMQL